MMPSTPKAHPIKQEKIPFQSAHLTDGKDGGIVQSREIFKNED